MKWQLQLTEIKNLLPRWYIPFKYFNACLLFVIKYDSVIFKIKYLASINEHKKFLSQTVIRYDTAWDSLPPSYFNPLNPKLSWNTLVWKLTHN